VLGYKKRHQIACVAANCFHQVSNYGHDWPTNAPKTVEESVVDDG